MFFICVLKACSLLLHVVLCFEDNDIVRVNGKVDPKWDFDVITLEHVFSDLEQEDAAKSAMERIRDALMDGKPARSVTLTDFEKDAVNHLCLLTYETGHICGKCCRI
ncbi:hypothetical protein NC653_028168 [Populus alba x Populus x berolinensis]|uniref:Uncharacterized protein n=1 Tax=Populus alba x Populus x berolinensis TaxID=444605 RepID=A0AAD6M9M9_9ROSI|nr:hypothetical protein NC653_028168 [Populus alba x Populus x berolinensis]